MMEKRIVLPVGGFAAAAPAWLILLGVSLAVLPGCPPKAEVVPGEQTLATRISVFVLADHLNLVVSDCSSCSAEMRGRGNSVVVYPDPDGGVYVNRRKLSLTGPVTCVNGVLYVPRDVEDTLRMALRTGVVLPPRPLESTWTGRDERPRPPPTGRVAGRVVLDPGHGGHDSGTTACRNCPEKVVALGIALEVARELRRQGVDVVMTRDDDTFIDLDSRVRLANRSRADLFVAIHADSSPDTSNAGHTIILPRGGGNGSESLAAAKAISLRMVTAGSTCHTIRKDVRGLRVLTYTNIPAILVETGFMSNAGEARRLSTESFRRNLGQSIAEGIADYLRKK